MDPSYFKGISKNIHFCVLKHLNILTYHHDMCCILAFHTAKKCHSKVMHRKEVTHSNGSYERKSCGQKLADEMGWGKKFPWYTHRLTHRKRVTCELHDSYFRLIKHAISKIEWAIDWAIEWAIDWAIEWAIDWAIEWAIDWAIDWALNYYITQSRQKSRQFQLQLETEL